MSSPVEIWNLWVQNGPNENALLSMWLDSNSYTQYNNDLIQLENLLQADISNDELVLALRETLDKIKNIDSSIDFLISSHIRKLEQWNIAISEYQNINTDISTKVNQKITELYNLKQNYNTEKTRINTQTQESLSHKTTLSSMTDSQLEDYILSLETSFYTQRDEIRKLVQDLQSKGSTADFWEDWISNDPDFMKNQYDKEMAEEMIASAVLKTVDELNRFAQSNTLDFDLSTIDPSLAWEKWSFNNKADKMKYLESTLKTLYAWVQSNDETSLLGPLLTVWVITIVAGKVIWQKTVFEWIKMILKSPYTLPKAWFDKLRWKKATIESTQTNTPENPDTNTSSSTEKVSWLNEKLSTEKMLKYIESVDKKIIWDLDKRSQLLSIKQMLDKGYLGNISKYEFAWLLQEVENWWSIKNLSRLKTLRDINSYFSNRKMNNSQRVELDDYLKEFETPEVKISILWEEYKIPEKYKAEVEELSKQLDDMDRISKIEADLVNIKQPELTKVKSELTTTKSNRTKAANKLNAAADTIDVWTSQKPKIIANPAINKLNETILKLDEKILNLEKNISKISTEINTAKIEVDRLTDIKNNIDSQFDEIFAKKWTTPTLSKLTDVEIKKIDIRRKFIQSLIKAIK